MAKRIKRIKPCCVCCHNYSVPIGDNGFCADCGKYVSDLRAAHDKLYVSLEWLVNLANNVGKAGSEPSPDEWDDAWYSAFKALGGDQMRSQGEDERTNHKLEKAD